MNNQETPSSAPGRHLPLVTPESHDFWHAGAHGQLVIRRCQACQRMHHPPLPICPSCQSWDVAGETVSGRGSVVSFTINRQAWLPGMQVPFVIAYVELEEQPGLWLMSNIVNCDPAAVHIGMAVRCTFVQQADVWLPLFEPQEGTP
jgi:uncharacterized OB-fold protein